MPSIKKVQDWYAQSFEVSRGFVPQHFSKKLLYADLVQDITTLSRPNLQSEVRERLLRPSKSTGRESKILSQTTQNPSVSKGQYRSIPQANGNSNGNGGTAKGSSRRYYASADDGEDWPPELNDYNKRFAKTLEGIKRRHDSVVTTVGGFVLDRHVQAYIANDA